MKQPTLKLTYTQGWNLAPRTQLGADMKLLEGVEAERRGPLGRPIIMRLDGRSFHSFTRGLDHPFDEDLTELMVKTTGHLVKELHANLGYTQSDEITLVWYLPAGSESQYVFDGRFQKLCSVGAAIASVYFVSALRTGWLDGKQDASPVFDARAWSVPELQDAYRCLLWRERDAVKNSITMQALAYFSHKALQNVNGEQKKVMLSAIGQPWEALPDKFKRGSYLKRVKTLRALTAAELALVPEKHRGKDLSLVERHDVRVLDIPLLTELKSPLATLFG